jgi:hypothetical protein
MRNPYYRLVTTWLLLITIPILSGCGAKEEVAEEVDRSQLREYVLNGDYELPIGAILRDTMKLTSEDMETRFNLGANEVTGTSTMITRQISEREQLATDKYREILIVNSQRLSLQIAGTNEKIDITDPLQGVAIIAEKVGGVWGFKLETGFASPEQQAKLDRLNEDDNDELGKFYPDHPVKVGDRWPMSQEAIEKLTGNGDDAKVVGSGTVELKAITQYDGEECAHILFSFQVTMTSARADANKQTMQMTMDGESFLSLETYIDRYVGGKGNLTIQQGMEDGIELNINGTYEMLGGTSIK